MILFPAIDLKDGHCVRLKLGDMREATVFNDDPAAQALTFERQGFQYLHMVDLNGAFEGRPVNGAGSTARGLEHRQTPGFGWLDGEVRPIEPANPDLKVPHMGWNTLELARQHPLFDGIATGPDGLHAYFVHGFHLIPGDERDVLATTGYGGTVTAAVVRDNLAGTQFHPEKSQKLGLQLIANFLHWMP